MYFHGKLKTNDTFISLCCTSRFYARILLLQKENFITFDPASGESGSIFMQEQF